MYTLWFGYFWPSLKGNGPEALVQTVVYAAAAVLLIPRVRRFLTRHIVTPLHAKLDAHHQAMKAQAEGHHEALLEQAEGHHEQHMETLKKHHEEILKSVKPKPVVKKAAAPKQ